MEVRADRKDLPADTKVLQNTTLAELVTRYKNTVTIKKRGRSTEVTVLRSISLTSDVP